MSKFRSEDIAADHGRYRGTLNLPIMLEPTTPLLVCIHGGGCDGRYFDLKGASFAVAAAERGIACLLVDRPGYGASDPPRRGSPIARGAEAVQALLRTVTARPVLSGRKIAMIGHSIGGAVALTFAAQHSHCLAALCVSGIGDRPSAEVLTFMAQVEGASALRPPADWFFGPDTTYGWRGIVALRATSQPWRVDEVEEVIKRWPDEIARSATAISCPVMLRLAEHERIWEATPQSVDRLRDLFTSVSADVGILPAGGHLYEAHHRGPHLIAAQLDFIEANIHSDRDRKSGSSTTAAKS